MAAPEMSAPADRITFNNTEGVQMQVGIQNVYGSVYHTGSDVSRKRRYSQVDAEQVEHDDAIVKSLSFPQMRDRRSNIRQPHRNTCEWIWEHVEFAQWLGSPKGLLWITGKAGAGKSTLMSYLYDNFCQTQNETGIYLDFFYSSRGVNLQKSPLGMLRSLLCQLFLQSDIVRTHIRAYYDRTYAHLMANDCNGIWHQCDLEKLFQTAILEAAKQRPVTVFIDALDEAGDSFAREVAAYLHTINDEVVRLNQPVKICISSRPYPNLTRVLALQVQVDQYNADDIALFVNDRLSLEFLVRDDDPYLQEWQSIKSSIIDQANGLFQWAYLIISQIESKIADGETPATIREWLSNVPSELNTTYTHIIQQVIDRGHRTRCLFLLQWILFAHSPISLADVRYILAAHEAPPHYCEKYEDLACFVKGDEHMLKQVRTWTGGMLELAESPSRREMSIGLKFRGSRILQVIHKSAHDFFRREGLRMLSDTSQTIARAPHSDTSNALDLNITANAFKALLRTCLAYIDHEFSRYKVWSHSILALEMRSPFIVHASASLLLYLRCAKTDKVDDIAKEVRTIQKIYTTWVSIIKQLSHIWDHANGYILDTPNPTLFHVACAADLGPMVSYLQSHQDWEAAIDEHGRSAAHVAAVYGALESAMALHKAGADFLSPTQAGDTPLSLAAMHQRKRFCRWLLEACAASTAHPVALQTALCPAAAAGDFFLVQLLLKRGVKINELGTDRAGQVASALHFAALRGHERIVRYLLAEGAVADHRTIDLGHIMEHWPITTSRPHTAMRILRVLLDVGADVNACDRASESTMTATPDGLRHESPFLHTHAYEHTKTPLMAAVDFRSEEMVQLLLRYGADPNTGPPEFKAYREWEFLRSSPAVLRLLINAGATFDNSDESWVEHFVQAAAYNHVELVETFLESETHTHLFKQACDQALFRVGKSDNLSMAQLLLHAGANINYTRPDTSYTPLFSAAKYNQLEMAKFLLRQEADPLALANDGKSLLHVAVQCFASENLIKWFIDSGVSLESQDLWGCTPLHTAIHHDITQVARTLLRFGASSNTRDMYGESPFDYTRSRGDHDLMRVMKNGSHIIEESCQRTRSLVIRRSVAWLADSLLDDTYSTSASGPRFNELGKCLLLLKEYDAARQCIQDAFCYVEPQMLSQAVCEICQRRHEQTYRQICLVCHTDICKSCFSFLKCQENDSRPCHDHEFLTVTAPSLSDYSGTGKDMQGVMMDKNRTLLADLVARYSEAESDAVKTDR